MSRGEDGRKLLIYRRFKNVQHLAINACEVPRHAIGESHVEVELSASWLMSGGRFLTGLESGDTAHPIE